MATKSAASHDWASVTAMRQAMRPSTSCSPHTEAITPKRERARTRPPATHTKKQAQHDRPESVDVDEEEMPLFTPTPTPSKSQRPRMEQRDDTSRLASLLDSAEQKLREQLLIASEKGKKHAVYLLLHQRVVDRDRCRGMRGYTPLHHAATRGHLDVLQLLVDFGWSVDGCNDALETPLHLASFSGHAAVVEFLLDKGADANARSVDGETPLFYAARKNHYRVVRLLLRRECDLTIKNRYGDVAEDEASSEKTLQEFATGREDLERLYRRVKAATAKSTLKTRSSAAAFRGEVTLSQKLREDVLAFLDLTSLCRASQVCYRWHRASDTPSLWRRLGVSRWELLLQTTVGIGAVAPMALFSGGSGRLQLSTAGLVGSVSKSSTLRRPSSCDPSTSSTATNSNGGSRFLGDHRRPQTARRPDLP